MDPYGTGQHSPFSDEKKTDPPLDRSKTRHGTVHCPDYDHDPRRDELDRPVYFNSLGETQN
jgi:hypothetical protein